MLLHNDYLIKMLTNRVDEFGNKDYQCVAFNKDHSKEVFDISLGSFNGYACKATYKVGGTYDPNKRNKLEPGPSTTLQQGDHLIQSFGKTGHIGVVHRSDAKGYYMIEQNNGQFDTKNGFVWGNGDGLANDAILIRYYTWGERPIIGIYRKK